MSESPLHGYRGDASSLPLSVTGLTLAISREAGGQGKAIGEQAGQRLGWTVYDREALDHLLRDTLAKKEILDQCNATTRKWIDARVQSLAAYRKFAGNDDAVESARLMLALAANGEVVLIGRGAGFILPAETTLHVQIVSPPEERIAYLADWLRLSHEEAEVEMNARDGARRKLLRQFTDSDPADPLGYDLVLNSARLGVDTCVTLIETTVKDRLMHPSSYEFELPEPA